MKKTFEDLSPMKHDDVPCFFLLFYWRVSIPKKHPHFLLQPSSLEVEECGVDTAWPKNCGARKIVRRLAALKKGHIEQGAHVSFLILDVFFVILVGLLLVEVEFAGKRCLLSRHLFNRRISFGIGMKTNRSPATTRVEVFWMDLLICHHQNSTPSSLLVH